MSPELQKYYEDRFDMMSRQGWKDLEEDVNQMFEAYSKISSISTVEDLYYKKGQLDILVWLLKLKETSEEAFKELSDEKNI
jgi:hypothetical protein